MMKDVRNDNNEKTNAQRSGMIECVHITLRVSRLNVFALTITNNQCVSRFLHEVPMSQRMMKWMALGSEIVFAPGRINAFA